MVCPLNGTGFGATCSSSRPGAIAVGGGGGVAVGGAVLVGGGVVVVDGAVGEALLLHITVATAAMPTSTIRPDRIVIASPSTRNRAQPRVVQGVRHDNTYRTLI